MARGGVETASKSKMQYRGLRGWLEQVDKMGELRKVDGAHWDAEMGGITQMLTETSRGTAPAILFDNVPGYPQGYRTLYGENSDRVKPFSVLMAISISSTVNAEVTIGPRVYYAMAKNGAFVKAAAVVHPRWHTPVVAILSQGACAILMTVTPIPDLFLFIGFSLTLFSVLAVALRTACPATHASPKNVSGPSTPITAYLPCGDATAIFTSPSSR